MSKKENTKRAAPIKGIVEASTLLGRHREHLRLVVSGRRTSPGLLARYNALKEGAANG